MRTPKRSNFPSLLAEFVAPLRQEVGSPKGESRKKPKKRKGEMFRVYPKKRSMLRNRAILIWNLSYTICPSDFYADCISASSESI